MKYIARLFALIVATALIFSPACSAHAQAPPQIAGDWLGLLSTPNGDLHLLLHLASAKDGGLSATLDSPDQGVLAIPVNVVALKGSDLNLTVDAVHGFYAGTVNKTATAIVGTWTQSGQSFNLDFKPAPPAPPKPAVKPARPSDIDGSWLGTLDTGSAKIRVLFKIVNTGDGLTAQMQSPDQSPIWANASSVTRAGSTLTIALSGIKMTFVGKIAADLGSVDGTFTQAGTSIPLVLTRSKN
jgi:hypothetical protein